MPCLLLVVPLLSTARRAGPQVPATLDLVVEIWSLPHAGAQQLLSASPTELEAASTFLGCVTVGCC
jgi:hypothetical protein